MAQFIVGRDLITLDELSDGAIAELLVFARDLKSRSECGEELDLLRGVTLFVYDPHKLSPAWDPFGLAMSQLGGQAVDVDPARINLSWSETFLDLFQQMDRTGHGLVMSDLRGGEGHVFMQDTATLMERPVLNMLSDEEAPFHTLATLMTLSEKLGADLSSLNAAVCWAPPGLSPKPDSLMRSLCSGLIRRNMDLRLACPLEFHPGTDFVEHMEDLVPGALELGDDPESAVEGADVVFAFNWSAPGEGGGLDETGELSERHAGWQFTKERFSLASRQALLGGGLPQSRDREIEASLLDDPRSIHLEESCNLLHVAKAALALILDLSREDRAEHESLQ